MTGSDEKFIDTYTYSAHLQVTVYFSKTGQCLFTEGYWGLARTKSEKKHFKRIFEMHVMDGKNAISIN